MKLWEVMKELSENPSKKFYSNTESLREKNFISIKRDGVLRWEIGGKAVKITVPSTANVGTLTEYDWQEVKQPVTWQEAIQAWLDGKKIKVELNGLEIPFTLYQKDDFEKCKWFIDGDDDGR